MKKHNERILTEADYSNMLPSAFDNSKKQAEPQKTQQKMDWSNTLPDFISGKKTPTTKSQPTAQTGSSKTGGMATDLVVQDAQKNGYVGTNQKSDYMNDVPVLTGGYEIFSDIKKLNELFDKDVIAKIEKDIENAPTATMTNINGKADELPPNIAEMTVYGNGNSVKVTKELLRDFYMLFKVDETKHIAYFGLKRNIGDINVKHVNLNKTLEVVQFQSGKILVLNEAIFKVLFK